MQTLLIMADANHDLLDMLVRAYRRWRVREGRREVAVTVSPSPTATSAPNTTVSKSSRW